MIYGQMASPTPWPLILALALTEGECAYNIRSADIQPVKKLFSFFRASERILAGHAESCWAGRPKSRNSKPFGNLLLGRLTLRRARSAADHLSFLSKNMFFDSLGGCCKIQPPLYSFP